MPPKRTRNIEKHVFMNQSEANELAKKSSRAGLTESALIRMLVKGYAPREKPDDRFYIVARQLAGIGNNLQQICRKANALNFIDVPALVAALEKLDTFENEISREYLNPARLE